jgi:hypothetical protein
MAHIDLQWNLTEIILGEAGGDNAAGFAKDSGVEISSLSLFSHIYSSSGLWLPGVAE